jgi:hypothetical protein
MHLKKNQITIIFVQNMHGVKFGIFNINCVIRHLIVQL